MSHEIKLQNFTLSLKKKLCKSIFANRIRREYLQNSQMVLNMVCNDNKIGEEKICLSYFDINVSENLISHQIFFGQRAR